MGDHGTTPSYRWGNEEIVPGFQVVEMTRSLEVHDQAQDLMKIQIRVDSICKKVYINILLS